MFLSLHIRLTTRSARGLSIPSSGYRAAVTVTWRWSRVTRHWSRGARGWSQCLHGHTSLVTLCPRLVTCHTSLVTRAPGQRTGGHVTARVTRHWSHGARGWSQCLRGHTALAIQSPGQRRGGQRDGGQQVAGPGLRVASPGHLATSAVCRPRAVPSLTPGSEVATLAAHLPPGARRDYGAVNCFISFGLQVM